MSTPTLEFSRRERTRSFLGTFAAFGHFLSEIPKLLLFSRTSPSMLLEAQAKRRPSSLALAWENERYTWRDVNERANRYATWFSEHGVHKGDVVALVMDNRPDFIFVLHGLNKLGATVSLINHNLTGAALAHALRICSARSAVAGSEFVESVDAVLGDVEGLSGDGVWVVSDPGIGPSSDPRCIDAEVALRSGAQIDRGYRASLKDTYCYIYTSGTTGLPKAAIISHMRMLSSSLGFAHLMFRTRPGDVTYVTLPLYHSSAMFLGWGHGLISGSAMALRRKFSTSQFFADARKFRATSFLYIGELCRYLLNSPEREDDRDHSLRLGVGNGMRPDIWEDFQKRFGVPLIREFYGATEGTGALLNTAGRPGMIGRKLPGQLIARCDLETGELYRDAEGHGEAVQAGEMGLLLTKITKLTSFDGYVDREASQKKLVENVLEHGDCYFNTGDLLQIHEGRWLSFADRVGDTFRWKGENVSTNEVAEILNGALGVLEANVYGVRVPNSDGRAGMAALSVDGSFDLADFAEFTEKSLPGYQRPIFLRILGGDMQITGTFKHQKFDYRKQGYDPNEVADALFVLRDGRYAPLDKEHHAMIEKGEAPLG